jgi:hypothetical protein
LYLYNKYLDKYNYKNYILGIHLGLNDHNEEEFKKDSNFINLKFWIRIPQWGCILHVRICKISLKLIC